MTRAFHYLVQALFALNETYFDSDKDALATIAGFEKRPGDFGGAIARILGHPGTDPRRLAASVNALGALFRATVELAEEGYRPLFILPGS